MTNFPDVSYRVQVKPVTVAPKTPNEPQGRDTFQTPNYATDLLVPYIPKNIKNIWECAVGNRKIQFRLENFGYSVLGTDIRNTDGLVSVYNFLSDVSYFPKSFDLSNWAIITNPPYSVKDMFIEKAFEYKIPFAFLINADYSGWQISLIKRGCEKIIPTRRIDFITPTGRNGKSSASQFHSMWLTYGFNLGRTETFVELSLKDKKENI